MPKNERVIRHAYENTLTASARLASFASGLPTMSSDGLIDIRQEVLAADDLLFFAINARRLMDTAAPSKHFKNVLVNVVVYETKKSETVWFVINKIIHHHDIDILRYNYQISGDYSANAIQQKNVKAVSPVVQVASDQGNPIAFALWDFITKFETGILNEIVEICAEKRLFLDEDCST